MAVLPPDPFDESSCPPSARSCKSSSSRPNSSQHRTGLAETHDPAVHARDLVSADSRFTVTPAREDVSKSTFMTSQFEEEAALREEAAETLARKAAEEAAATAVKAAEIAAAKKAAEEATKAAEIAAAKKAAEEAAKTAAKKAAEEEAAQEAARQEAEDQAARATAAQAAAKQALEDELEHAEQQAQEAEEEALRVQQARTAAALEVKRYEMAERVAQQDAELKHQQAAEAKWRDEVAAAAAAAAAEAEQTQVAVEDPIQWSEELKEYVGAPAEDDDEDPAKSYEEIAVTVDAFLAMQDSMREHLQQYCQTLEQQRDDEGNKLIEFPENFADVLEVMHDEARQRPSGLEHSKWQKYLNDQDDCSQGSGKDEIARQRKMIQGMQMIQKLDMKLAAKSKEAAEMKRLRDAARNQEEDGSNQRERQLARVEDTVKEELRSANWIGQKQYKLSEEEEARVLRLLTANLDDLQAQAISLGTDLTGFKLSGEDQSRLLDIDQALASITGAPEEPAAPATHCDGSLVQQALPKSGDSSFLQFEREKREERLAAASIEHSLHRLQAASAWPRPDEVDRAAVSQVLANCQVGEQSEQERARVSALVAELRAEGNRTCTGQAAESIASSISVDTTATIQGSLKLSPSPSARGQSRSPQPSPGTSGSPVEAHKVRSVTLNRRQLVMVNPVLANNPSNH